MWEESWEIGTRLLDGGRVVLVVAVELGEGGWREAHGSANYHGLQTPGGTRAGAQGRGATVDGRPRAVASASMPVGVTLAAGMMPRPCPLLSPSTTPGPTHLYRDKPDGGMLGILMCTHLPSNMVVNAARRMQT